MDNNEFENMNENVNENITENLSGNENADMALRHLCPVRIRRQILLSRSMKIVK